MLADAAATNALLLLLEGVHRLAAVVLIAALLRAKLVKADLIAIFFSNPPNFTPAGCRRVVVPESGPTLPVHRSEAYCYYRCCSLKIEWYAVHSSTSATLYVRST